MKKLIAKLILDLQYYCNEILQGSGIANNLAFSRSDSVEKISRAARRFSNRKINSRLSGCFLTTAKESAKFEFFSSEDSEINKDEWSEKLLLKELTLDLSLKTSKL